MTGSSSAARTRTAPTAILASAEELTGSRKRLEVSRDGRVTGVTAENWSERYAYDEAGNQTSASWPGAGDASGPREYAGTRITRAGRVRYEHDAQGRVILRQRTRLSRKPETWRYGWDAEDRLVSLTTPDGTRWRYLYDALGRRSAKQRLAEDGATVVEEVTFTWDGDTLCEQTTSTTGSPALHHPPTSDHDRDKPRRPPLVDLAGRRRWSLHDHAPTPTHIIGTEPTGRRLRHRASRKRWPPYRFSSPAPAQNVELMTRH
ncbi:hypothetical protein SBADM41S_06171 [Streptomyces badius]